MASKVLFLAAIIFSAGTKCHDSLCQKVLKQSGINESSYGTSLIAAASTHHENQQVATCLWCMTDQIFN